MFKNRSLYFVWTIAVLFAHFSLAAITLHAASAPVVVTVPPANQTACVGDTATFSVTATGVQTYQWFKATTSLTGKTNSTLVLTNIGLADAATYKVKLT